MRTLAGTIALLDLLQAKIRVSVFVQGFFPQVVPAALLLLLAGTGTALFLLALRPDVRAWMAAGPLEAAPSPPAAATAGPAGLTLYTCPGCAKAYRLQRAPAPGTRCPPCSRAA